MIAVEQYFWAYLKSNEDLAGSLGGQEAFRLYPCRIPQGEALPAARYMVIDKRLVHSLGGIIGTTVEASIRVDVFAETFDPVLAIQAHFQAQIGDVQAAYSSVYWHRVSIESYAIDYLPPLAGDDVGRFVLRMPVRIHAGAS